LFASIDFGTILAGKCFHVTALHDTETSLAFRIFFPRLIVLTNERLQFANLSVIVFANEIYFLSSIKSVVVSMTEFQNGATW